MRFLLLTPEWLSSIVIRGIQFTKRTAQRCDNIVRPDSTTERNLPMASSNIIVFSHIKSTASQRTTKTRTKIRTTKAVAAHRAKLLQFPKSNICPNCGEPCNAVDMIQCPTCGREFCSHKECDGSCICIRIMDMIEERLGLQSEI